MATAGKNSPQAKRMRFLREVVHEAPTQTAFAKKLGIEKNRWINFESGYPVSLHVAKKLIQITPGLTLDWIYFGKLDGLPLVMARVLERAA